VGEWNENAPNGKGVYFCEYNEGEMEFSIIYAGNWNQGYMVGFGVIIADFFEYEGNVADG
jgi:hypothetical protein